MNKIILIHHQVCNNYINIYSNIKYTSTPIFKSITCCIHTPTITESNDRPINVQTNRVFHPSTSTNSTPLSIHPFPSPSNTPQSQSQHASTSPYSINRINPLNTATNINNTMYYPSSISQPFTGITPDAMRLSQLLQQQQQQLYNPLAGQYAQASVQHHTQQHTPKHSQQHTPQHTQQRTQHTQQQQAQYTQQLTPHTQQQHTPQQAQQRSPQHQQLNHTQQQQSSTQQGTRSEPPLSTVDVLDVLSTLMSDVFLSQKLSKCEYIRLVNNKLISKIVGPKYWNFIKTNIYEIQLHRPVGVRDIHVQCSYYRIKAANDTNVWQPDRKVSQAYGTLMNKYNLQHYQMPSSFNAKEFKKLSVLDAARVLYYEFYFYHQMAISTQSKYGLFTNINNELIRGTFPEVNVMIPSKISNTYASMQGPTLEDFERNIKLHPNHKMKIQLNIPNVGGCSQQKPISTNKRNKRRHNDDNSDSPDSRSDNDSSYTDQTNGSESIESDSNGTNTGIKPNIKKQKTSKNEYKKIPTIEDLLQVLDSDQEKELKVCDMIIYLHFYNYFLNDDLVREIFTVYIYLTCPLYLSNNILHGKKPKTNCVSFCVSFCESFFNTQ